MKNSCKIIPKWVINHSPSLIKKKHIGIIKCIPLEDLIWLNNKIYFR